MSLWPLIAASSLNWPPDEIQTTSAFLSDASSIFDIASLVFPETLFTVTNERLLVLKGITCPLTNVDDILAITYFDKALAINPKNDAALTGKKQALALPMPELL